MADRLVIEAGHVVTVDPAFRVIRNGAVAIERDRIVALGPADEIDQRDADVRRFPRHVAIPGLVNGHTHVAGSLFRGLLEDRPDAFYGYALPMEPAMDPEAIYALSMVGISELLLSGCTVMNDMFHHAAETARAARDTGIRAQIAHKVFDADLPGIGKGRREFRFSDGIERLEENVRLHAAWHGAADGRIAVRFGLHAADTCSPALMAEIVNEAGRHRAGIHTHVAQSPVEHAFITETYGCGSAVHLEHNGVLGPDTVAAHLIWADGPDVAALARTDTHVAHCPACVTKAVGAIGPYRDIYAAGITVGWGTDWITMDPWDAMRFGIVGYRMAYGDDQLLTADETLLSANEALWRFTLGSARMLGMADDVGSLEVGKKADLTLIDVDQPHLAPLYDPVSALVYNASGRDVTHVLIDGELVVEDRRITGIDTSVVVAEAQRVAEKIWATASTPAAMPLPRPSFAGAGS
ncbi:MAG: hypothetical protein JWN46_3187 [Acidimicrobiales bacterium]|nr:hypothetical protein [Acidimicrobiales bacterium]